MFHFAAVSKVARVRKCRSYGAIGVERGVPTAMIEMEGAVDNNVPLFGPYAGCRQRLWEEFLISLDLAHLGRLLVADPSLDQHSLPAGSHNHGVEAEQNAVQRVRRRTLLPQWLRHHAEHGSAVKPVRSVRANG